MAPSGSWWTNTQPFLKVKPMKTETSSPFASSTSNKFNFKFPVTDVHPALSAPKPDELSDSDYMIVLIHKQVTERANSIPYKIDVTLEEICGPAFWDPLSDGDQRYAGKCMKGLSIAYEVPFQIVSEKFEYPVRYQRT